MKYRVLKLATVRLRTLERGGGSWKRRAVVVFAPLAFAPLPLDIDMAAEPTGRQIVIIGGGIIGASTAYYLTRHPSFDSARDSITVLEGSSIAAGASGKAGGLLALDWYVLRVSADDRANPTKQARCATLSSSHLEGTTHAPVQDPALPPSPPSPTGSTPNSPRNTEVPNAGGIALWTR